MRQHYCSAHLIFARNLTDSGEVPIKGWCCVPIAEKARQRGPRTATGDCIRADIASANGSSGSVKQEEASRICAHDNGICQDWLQYHHPNRKTDVVETGQNWLMQQGVDVAKAQKRDGARLSQSRCDDSPPAQGRYPFVLCHCFPPSRYA